MRDGQTHNNGFVITKQPRGTIKGNTKHPEGIMQINNLLNCLTSQKVADSAWFCHMEKESMGIWLRKCMIPEADLPIVRSWSKFVSQYIVIQTQFPFTICPSSGISSVGEPYTVAIQSYLAGVSLKVDS